MLNMQLSGCPRNQKNMRGTVGHGTTRESQLLYTHGLANSLVPKLNTENVKQKSKWRMFRTLLFRSYFVFFVCFVVWIFRFTTKYTKQKTRRNTKKKRQVLCVGDMQCRSLTVREGVILNAALTPLLTCGLLQLNAWIIRMISLSRALEQGDPPKSYYLQYFYILTTKPKVFFQKCAKTAGQTW
jgi:hypothetical protein